MRRALACAFLVAAGCRAEPDDVFFWSGKAQLADGPAVDRRVTLLTSRDFFCNGQQGVSQDVLPPFKPVFETRTDADGAFLLEPMRYQVQAANRASYCARLVVESATGGARTSAQFASTASDQELPPFFLWEDGPPVADRTAEGWRVQLPPWPREPRNPPGTEVPVVRDPNGGFTLPDEGTQFYYQWRLLRGEDPAWRKVATRSGEVVTLAPELVEDWADVRVDAEALTRIDQAWDPVTGGGGSSFLVRSSGGSAPLSGAALRPISRGQPCVLNGQRADPCPATDGVLAQVSYAFSGGTPPPFSPAPVQLSFAVPATPRLLVLRDTVIVGDAHPFTIEVSPDGEQWTAVGSVDLRPPSRGEPGKDVYVFPELEPTGQWAQVPLQPFPGARHLRVRTGEQGLVYALREVSVFE